jgi:hypothetical protein
VVLKHRYINAYAQIDTRLKRRDNLIPNLVARARAYLAHESSTWRRLSKPETRPPTPVPPKTGFSFARQAYHDAVRAYNQSREIFPAILFVNLFGFLSAEFWYLDAKAERVPIKINLDRRQNP